MSLLALQTVLARLYLEPEFRAAYFQQPEAFLSTPDLSSEERAYLGRLDQAQVERFSRSLRNKRLGTLRGRLPALVNSGGERFPRWFEAYCEAHPSVPEGREDAIAFTGFLCGRLPHDPTLHRPAYLPDLIRMERCRLDLLEAARSLSISPQAKLHSEEPRRDESSSLPGPAGCRPSSAPPDGELPLSPTDRPLLARTARLLQTRFDFERLFTQLQKGQTGCPPPQSSWHLLAVVDGAFRIKRLTEVTAQLLRRCDGTRSWEQILEEVTTPSAQALPQNWEPGGVDRTRFEAECQAFLVNLRRQGSLIA